MLQLEQNLYFAIHRLRGSSVGQLFRRYQQEDRQRLASQQTAEQQLIALLDHCQHQVPYYADLLNPLSIAQRQDPIQCLQRLPILTKARLRENFERLQSGDLAKRRWYSNTSGGSTGEPVRLIQDQAYWDHETAIQMLSMEWTGQRFGEPTLYLWGFSKDIARSQSGLRWVVNRLIAHNELVNAYHMTPHTMQAVVQRLNTHPPRLIVAYANVIYELARFIERQQISLRPQQAILSSASTLHPFMREKVEAVFQCKVFDRYGSREVGDIASECEAHRGLHVFPWTCYLEIVDDAGLPVPPGEEGNILVTSLANYAMPLLRYQIGDRGILAADETCPCGRRGQRLVSIAGRINDTFQRADGTLVSGGYFTRLLYYRDWVRRFQVVQKSYTSILFKIVGNPGTAHRPEELEEIRQKAQTGMGADCHIDFEFVDDIPVSASGKFRYTICEVVR
jgi:phenylacetate-CoA ligase